MRGVYPTSDGAINRLEFFFMISGSNVSERNLGVSSPGQTLPTTGLWVGVIVILMLFVELINRKKNFAMMFNIPM